MAKVKVEVEVEKESYELALALAGLVVALLQKKPLSDVIATNLPLILTGVAGIEQLPNEAKEDLPALIRSFTLAGSEIAGALLAKKA